MRAYFFVNNLYMRELQWGLQSLHCLGELHNKYEEQNEVEYNVLREWERDHKTVIFLGAANVAGLLEVYQTFEEMSRFSDLPYPFAKFEEDEQSLNSAITSVGIVIPAKIYDLARLARESGLDPAQYLRENGTVGTWMASYTSDDGIVEVSKTDVALAELLNNYRLA